MEKQIKRAFTHTGFGTIQKHAYTAAKKQQLWNIYEQRGGRDGPYLGIVYAFGREIKSFFYSGCQCQQRSFPAQLIRS
jgi:hypothetical protein